MTVSQSTVWRASSVNEIIERKDGKAVQLPCCAHDYWHEG